MALPALRRIVTANDAEGKSFVLSDAPTPHVLATGVGRGLVDFWATAPGLASGDADGVIQPMRLDPPAGGTVFRFFQVPPAAGFADRAAAEAAATAAFAAMGAGHVREDTSLHPGMHRSHTLDYVVLLSGRLTLLLEKEEVELAPFDVVIQRETNHAWINKGSEPVLCAAVLVSADAL
jgi:hypothetical protein